MKKQDNFNPCLFGRKSFLFFTFLILLSCHVSTTRAFHENNSKKSLLIVQRKKFKFVVCPKKYKKKWTGILKDNSIFLYKKGFKFVSSTKYKNFSKKNVISVKKNFELLHLGEMLEKIAESDKWNLNHSKIHLKDILVCQFDLLSNENSKFFCKCNLKLKKKTLLQELFQSKLRNGSEDKKFFRLLTAYIRKKGKYSKEIFLLDNAKNFLHVAVFNGSDTNVLNQFVTVQSASYFYERFLNFSSNIVCSLVKENWNKKKMNKSFVSAQFELIFNFNLSSNQIKKQKLEKDCYKKYSGKTKNFYIFKNFFLERNLSIKSNSKNKKKVFVIVKEHKNSFYINESFGFFKKKIEKRKLKKKPQLEELNTPGFCFIQILKLKKKKYKPLSSCLRFFINFYSISKCKKNFLPDFEKNKNCNISKTAFLFHKHVFNTNVFLTNKKKENTLYLFSRNATLPDNAENTNCIAKLNYMRINSPKNSCESFKLYKKSALLGNLDAGFSLSQMNFYGGGKKRKKDDFFLLIKASSDKNFIPNQYNYILASIKQYVNEINLFNCIKKLFENYLEKRNFKRTKQTYMEMIVNTFFSKNRDLNEIEITEFSEKLFYLTFNVLFGLIEDKLTSVSLSLAYFNKDSGWYKLLSVVKIKNILIENKQFFLSTELAKKHEEFGFIKKASCFSSKILKKMF